MNEIVVIMADWVIYIRSLNSECIPRDDSFFKKIVLSLQGPGSSEELNFGRNSLVSKFGVSLQLLQKIM